MPLGTLEAKNVDKKKVAFFRFKELNGRYLLTSDVGEYCFLAPPLFRDFLSGKIEQSNPEKYSELQTKGFIRDYLNLSDLSQKYALKNSFLCRGASLHIVVVTLRCDHDCIYCQAGSKSLKTSGLDMDIATARKALDLIFQSPSDAINLEIQGGEPLANWDTVKFIIDYSKEKNKSSRKNMSLSLVSNFTFMTDERLEFLIKNKVGICASLDGNEALHNRNRPAKINSYRNTVKWIKKAQAEIKKSPKSNCRINALTTITKASLPKAREIIDEYIDLGLEGMHLRPANPFGVDKRQWQEITFSVAQFLEFYKGALDYIIELNLKGKNFYERTAKIFLSKILTEQDPNFLDIRSPCGAGCGQIAYNFDGNVYTCDEARMLSMAGDESFRIGNVAKNTYKELIESEALKTLQLSSCLENIPGCNECVYKPYCGVCPIYNYFVSGNPFLPNKNNERCSIHTGILDYLFEKLNCDEAGAVLKNWVKAG